ncbi:MAG: insulinase family protein, partial [Patescibacteria group bacterium]
FLEYHKTHYTAEKSIVVVVGDLKESQVKSEILKQFKNISSGNKVGKLAVKENQRKPAMLISKKKTEQTHMIVAFQGFKGRDKRSLALSLLAAVLGKGFSSRLFEKLRDEMGACYYVGAGNDEYTDHGFLAISAGVESRRLKEVLKVILKECLHLTKELVTIEELNKVKDYLVGNLYLRLETSDALATFYAMDEIVKGELETPKELEEKIRSITPKAIQKVAKEIFQNKNLNLAVVGDIKNPQKLKKILKL